MVAAAAAVPVPVDFAPFDFDFSPKDLLLLLLEALHWAEGVAAEVDAVAFALARAAIAKLRIRIS